MSGWPTATTRDHKDGASEGTVPINGLLGRTVWLAGWPTARSADGEKNVRTAEGALSEIKRKGSPQDLAQAVVVAGWPTATVGNATGSQSSKGLSATGKTSDGRKVSVALPHVAKMAGWPTATRTDAARGEKYDPMAKNMTLNMAVQRAGWPTPNAGPQNDTDTKWRERREECKKKHGNNGFGLTLGMAVQEVGPMRLTSSGETRTGSFAEMPSGGQLNPAHSRWIMGYPPEWDACAVTAMPSSRKSRKFS